MTTLIQQPNDSACVLAAIAMSQGASTFFDVWNADDLDAVLKSRGIADLEPWLKRLGLVNGKHYLELYCHADSDRVFKAMLGMGMRALLSVNSLNHAHGSHMVYYDGSRVWDPQEGVQGRQHFRYLGSLVLNRAYVFRVNNATTTGEC